MYLLSFSFYIWHVATPTYMYMYLTNLGRQQSVLQAKNANAGIKSKLVYRDEEELDTGVQKVQPLPFLGVCMLT